MIFSKSSSSDIWEKDLEILSLSRPVQNMPIGLIDLMLKKSFVPT
jgi:hypothetical protein